MRWLTMTFSMILGLFHVLGGLANALILANWNSPAVRETRLGDESRFLWFCTSLWYIATGLGFLTGWMWMRRKVAYSGERLIAATCLSASGVAVYTLAAWKVAGTSALVEFLVCAPVIVTLFVMSMKQSRWKQP